ncbi:MAG: amidohydrolase family protein [Candidatus Latescibacteria bacterium]|nr:amidohydrolase family protein [Candidatus Latescibacterota bacterium]
MARICDSHCHLKHGNVYRTEYDPARIVEIMDEAGIDKSVVFAMSTTSEHATSMAHEAAQRFPDRLIPYAYALPHIADSAIVHIERGVRDLGFRGIKMHVGEVSLTDYIIDPVFELAAGYGVPCLVDFGGRIDAARRILKSFPKTTIIMAHFGRYLCTDRNVVENQIALAVEHENAVLDTSGVLLPWAVPEAVRKVGSDRIVFAVDGPYPYDHTTEVEFATVEIERIRSLPIPEKDKENIFWNTIARILKL